MRSGAIHVSYCWVYQNRQIREVEHIVNEYVVCNENENEPKQTEKGKLIAIFGFEKEGQTKPSS